MQKILIDAKKPVKLKVNWDGMIEINAPFKIERGKKKPRGVKILPIESTPLLNPWLGKNKKTC